MLEPRVMNARSLTLRRLDSAAVDFIAQLDALIAFAVGQDPARGPGVAATIADVRARGDAAVLEYTAKFDRVHAASVAELEIKADDMRRAFDAMAPQMRTALETAADRVEAYHQRQKMASWSYRERDGTE